jgi:hypothetical protein
MMRIHPNLPILMMMIVVFVSSFAIMSRNRGSPNVPAPDTAVRPVEHAIALPSRTDRPPPVMDPREGATAPPNAAPAVKTAPTSVPGIQTTGAPLPVVFQINHNHRQNVTEAILGSLSDAPLSIQVSVVSPNSRGAAQLQLELDPHGSKTFGTREGVELNSGDQITLQSPPFQEQTQQVP